MNWLWIVVVAFGLYALLATVLWVQARSNCIEADERVMREIGQRAELLAEIERLKEELKGREGAITITTKMIVPETVSAEVALPAELENAPGASEEIERQLRELLGEKVYRRAEVQKHMDFVRDQVVFMAKLMIVNGRRK